MRKLLTRLTQAVRVLADDALPFHWRCIMKAPAKTSGNPQKGSVRQGTAATENRRKIPAASQKDEGGQSSNAATEGAQQLLVAAAMPFAFNGQAIRVAVQDGQPWFVSADVCALLEHSNSRMAVAGLDDDEKGVTSAYTLGGEQSLSVVNESGLYHLIFKSRKPQAKAFRRWVTTEVLPSIRKTGNYKAAEAEAPEEIRPLQVELPGPGRYVIMTVPGKAAHVRRTEYDAMLVEADALDRQLMACALTTTAAYWHKLQQQRAIGAHQAEAVMLQKLERVILDGSNLGADCLHVLSIERGERVDEGA